MIYTLGKDAIYDRCVDIGISPQAIGRKPFYQGRSVWDTFERAKAHLTLDYPGVGFSVYGVLADWETETEAPKFYEWEAHDNSDWHDLLVDATLVRVSTEGGL